MNSQVNHKAAGAGGRSNADTPALDVERIRKDFPVLNQQIHGKPLVYLDNAATSQKPQAVIDALTHYYAFDNSNVHRGVHTLSMRATDAYENTREKVRQFINAQDQSELIFVRGTTEGINLVAQSFGQAYIHSGDEVLITAMEHHSNIVPWQILCEDRGATLNVAPMNEAGEIPLDSFEKLLTDRTKIFSVVHVSNALGTVNPVAKMIQMAHNRGIPVLIDGAQAAPHIEIDVQALDCEFYVFSSHKMYGPTGIGVVYGKHELLDAMPPYQGGGDMIASVTFEKTIYNTLPHKFEAGTPNVAGVVGLGAAIDYIGSIGLPEIGAHEHNLIEYAEEKLLAVDGVQLIGTARNKAGCVSFVLEDIHPHDVGTILDQEGIAVRTGHHCTQPVMDFFGIPATSRASFGMYNTKAEIDALIDAIHKVKEVFG
ncbi:MAG: cysteine desulfurase [Candidatus Latescibacterota bacterium]|nr:MAG: cysteine desulfurase [Candidatus Latescibacterota bacterium]